MEEASLGGESIAEAGFNAMTSPGASPESDGSPPRLPPPPPAPPEVMALYAQIRERTKEWWKVSRRVFLAGFGMFGALGVLLLGLFLANLLGALPVSSPNRLPTSALMMLIALLLAVEVGIVLFVRYGLRSWKNLLEGRVSQDSGLVKDVDRSLRARTGRGLWGESDSTPEGAPLSDLAQAIFLMRAGDFLVAYFRRAIVALFLGVLLFGGMGVLILTASFGDSLPLVLGWNPVFLFGSLVVLTVAIWLLTWELVESVKLEKRYRPLVDADLWIEQMFWRRF